MRRVTHTGIMIFFLLAAALAPVAAQARVDWEVSGAVQLEATPLAVAQTQDGDLTFLLTDRARVEIYGADGKLAGTIPVDPAVVDIAISTKGEQLYLINATRKTLQTIAVQFSADIDAGDSPFIGPAVAKVVVVVFSDFQ